MHRLYYDDSYTRSFNTTIIERTDVEGHPALVLNHTYFYPTGGGQPHDTGLIGAARVIDVIVRESDKAVLHVVDQPVTEDQVNASIDWGRRFDHMQQHTGQHILTQAFVQTAGLNTVGFHLSDASLTIDLDAPMVSAETIQAVETLANQIIWEDRPVTALIIDPEKSGDVRMRKMPEHLLTGGLRVIEVAGFDSTACGGTHIRQTGEIGMIKVLRAEKRGSKTRIEFACGGRALRDYTLKNVLANQLTADLTVGIEEIPTAIGRLQDQLKSSQRALKTAQESLLNFEVDALIRTAKDCGTFGLICATFEGRGAGNLRMLASRLAAYPGVVALLGSSGERANLVFARSADITLDMPALLNQLLEKFGGRGGGQPALAQGSGQASHAELEAALQALGASLCSA